MLKIAMFDRRYIFSNPSFLVSMIVSRRVCPAMGGFFMVFRYVKPWLVNLRVNNKRLPSWIERHASGFGLDP